MVDNGQQESLYPSSSPAVIPEEPLFPGGERDRKAEFPESLQATIQDYYRMVIDQLPPALDPDGHPLDSLYDLDPTDIDQQYYPYDFSKLTNAAKGLNFWNTKSFPRLLTHCQKPADMTKLSEDEQHEATLQTDLRHDLAGDIITNLVGGITDDDIMYEEVGYIGNPYMVQWPLHIMDRIYKQFTKTPDVKPIHGQNAIQFIAGVFQSRTVLDREKYTYDIDYKTPFELEGDFDYLLGVLANPLNNTKQIGEQKALKDIRSMIRVLPDPDKKGHVIIQIRDNIGGMPDDLLEFPEGSDTHKALARGETRRKGGTGAGLAIVNEIVRDHFHGSISLKNEPYPETDQQGLVMNISLPGKLTGPQSE
ncbi:HAMP domain-containing histidine kinase [Candidatus Roizmanbacteria bacterium]|nr:MAG: HAMP domain-containing histidine kinase [Candidatus Roizmanbacteria bacterium]